MEHCLQSINEEAVFLKHCPKLFVSALTGRNLDQLFGLVQEVYEAGSKRVTTHQLNKFLQLAIQKNHPPMIGGKRLRIYYMAQVDINPPRFIFFVNNIHLLMGSYKKYLQNQFREAYSFTGVPLLFHLRGKEKREKPGESSESKELWRRDQSEEDGDDFMDIEGDSAVYLDEGTDDSGSFD